MEDFTWEDLNDRVSGQAGIEARQHKWATGHCWFKVAGYGPNIFCANPDCGWGWNGRDQPGN